METEACYFDEKRWRQISRVLDFILSQPKTMVGHVSEEGTGEATQAESAGASDEQSQAKQCNSKARIYSYKHSQGSEQTSSNAGESDERVEYVQLKLL